MRKTNKPIKFYIFIIFIICMLFFLYHILKKTDNEILIKSDEAPAQILEVSKEGLLPNSYIKAFVSRVVDGDTIAVIYKKNNYKVRFLDVDTPESVKAGVPIQAYAEEASKFTKKNLLDKEVKLVFEKSLKDKYGRLLAHVLLKNNEYFNVVLVRRGYARIEILKPNNAYEEYFKKQQELAITDKLGVWSLKADKNPFIQNNAPVNMYQGIGNLSNLN